MPINKERYEAVLVVFPKDLIAEVRALTKKRGEPNVSVLIRKLIRGSIKANKETSCPSTT